MKVVLLVMTDGREHYLRQSWLSALKYLDGIDHAVINDDSGGVFQPLDTGERPWRECVLMTQTRTGFAGAIRGAWAHLARDHPDATHVFHLEADFVFREGIPVREMCELLDERPYLAQVALRRQPWNDEERAAGGVIEVHPSEFHDRSDRSGRHWLDHRLFFTTNPCVYRADLVRSEWPAGAQSEGRFTHNLLAEGLPWGVAGEDVRFAYWGRREDAPLVEHIGHERVGSGY